MWHWMQKQRPEWQQTYRRQPRIPRNQPESQLRYSVVDVETTGFDLRKDRILSIAVATIEDQQLRVDRLWNRIVFQENAAINDAVKVHGILPSESSHGISEAEMIEQLVQKLTGTVVVGHHIRFDATMLNAAMERHFGLRFRNRMIDTGDLAMAEIDAFKKSAYTNQRPPSLDEVCQQLEINPVDRHTALGDAFTTAQVFLYLRGRMQQRLKERFALKHLPLGRL